MYIYNIYIYIIYCIYIYIYIHIYIYMYLTNINSSVKDLNFKSTMSKNILSKTHLVKSFIFRRAQKPSLDCTLTVTLKTISNEM